MPTPNNATPPTTAATSIRFKLSTLIFTLHFLPLVCSLRAAPGKNKRHKKAISGLVSGVESGLSRGTAANSLLLKRIAVCATSHKAEDAETNHRNLAGRVLLSSHNACLLYVC